ncbi:UNVERIFIED_CONTAM: hypothetical protein Sradi_4919200, partial [Sesamum radiatum]
LYGHCGWGSSLPLRSYRDAVIGVAVCPPSLSVSFDTASFQPMGMLTRDQGMKISIHAEPSALDARPRFSWDFSVEAVNVRHVFLTFALEEDYRKLKIRSIWFVDGFPMRVFKWTPTFNPREESPIVSVWVCLPELPIQFFDREALFSKARLLGTSLRTDVSTTTLRAQWELHTRCKGERVVFEDVDGCLGASSSGVKGTKDGRVKVELHDRVLPARMPELMLHREAVHSGTEKDILVSQRRPDVCQGVEDVAICSLELIESCVVPLALDPCVEQLVCMENLIPDTEDAALCPPGKCILQTDTEDVISKLVRHRWARLLGDEPGAHLVSPDRGKRILNRVRKQHHLNFLAILEPMVPLDGRFMARRLVYAKCDTIERRALWDTLRAVSIGTSPWIVGGDFNTVLSPDERSGGSAPSGIAMSDFHDAIADSALVDAGYVGSSYT